MVKKGEGNHDGKKGNITTMGKKEGNHDGKKKGGGGWGGE